MIPPYANLFVKEIINVDEFVKSRRSGEPRIGVRGRNRKESGASVTY
jgi:hypothetical protein